MRTRMATAVLSPTPSTLSIRRGVTISRVVNLEFLARAVDCHIELVFAGIDTCTECDMLSHLRRPFLVMRTHGSFNHPGPMKSRPRSCYEPQSLRLRLGAIRRSAVRPGRPPGPDRSSWNDRSYHVVLIQGWVEFFTRPNRAARCCCCWVSQARPNLRSGHLFAPVETAQQRVEGARAGTKRNQHRKDADPVDMRRPPQLRTDIDLQQHRHEQQPQ